MNGHIFVGAICQVCGCTLAEVQDNIASPTCGRSASGHLFGDRVGDGVLTASCSCLSWDGAYPDGDAARAEAQRDYWEHVREALAMGRGYDIRMTGLVALVYNCCGASIDGRHVADCHATHVAAHLGAESADRAALYDRCAAKLAEATALLAERTRERDEANQLWRATSDLLDAEIKRLMHLQGRHLELEGELVEAYSAVQSWRAAAIKMTGEVARLVQCRGGPVDPPHLPPGVDSVLPPPASKPPAPEPNTGFRAPLPPGSAEPTRGPFGR